MRRTTRVLEELCADDACPRQAEHWHRFSIASFLKEKPGQYTATLRVRVVKAKERTKRHG